MVLSMHAVFRFLSSAHKQTIDALKIAARHLERSPKKCYGSKGLS